MEKFLKNMARKFPKELLEELFIQTPEQNLKSDKAIIMLFAKDSGTKIEGVLRVRPEKLPEGLPEELRQKFQMQSSYHFPDKLPN